jgi:4-hydroxybenzoate polyprenyltransferase
MRILRLFDFVFLLRPIILIPFWSFLLLGYAHSRAQWLWIINMDGHLLPILFIATAFMGIIHILNQIADRESDQINQKLFFIPNKIISIKQAYWQILILLIFTIPPLIYIKINGILFLFTLSILPLGILYSLPPFRLKAKPVIDTLLNAIGYGWVAFSLGWLAGGAFSWTISLHSLPYIIAVAAMYINTTLIDASGDRQNGFTTTGIWLGKKKATFISLICIVLVIISGIMLRSWVCLITAVVSLPVYYLAFKFQSERWIRLSLHLPGRLFVFLTGLIFPYYLLFLILLYFFTRWYYKKRFNMTYPAID